MATKNKNGPDAGELRRRAENIYRENTEKNPELLEAPSHEAALWLVRELRVQKIELELRNEELRQSRAELEDSCARYFDLFALAPVGYLMISETGLIMEANLAFSIWVGVPSDILIKQSFSSYILPEDRDSYCTHQKKLFETDATQVCELRLLKKDAKTLWIQLEMSGIQDESAGNAAIRATLSDISKRKQAEEILRKDEERFRIYFQESKSVMLLVDSGTFRIADANPAAADYYGYSIAQLIQKNVDEINMLTMDEIVEKMTNVISQHENIFVFPHRLASGEIRQVEVHLTPIHVGNKARFLSIIHDVTDRIQLEMKIRESEANFFSFFNTINDFLFVLDEDGRILHVNRTVKDRLGYSVEELTGQSVLSVHPEKERAEAGRIVRKMLAGEADSCHIPLINKNGNLIPVETRVAEGIWNGHPALFGVSKDVSALKMSEEKLARVFKVTSSLMAISTLEEGIYLDVNDAFLHTLGFEREEVVGRRSVDLNIFQEELIRETILDQLQKESSIRNLEVQFRTKTGDPVFGLFSAEIVTVASRQLLITTVNDVTELKLVEQRLRESEEHFDLSMEATRDGLWDWNLQTGFCYFRPGYRERDLKAMATRKPSTNEEWIKFANDGRRILVETIKTPMYDADGKLIGVLGVARDITERKRTEEALRESEERLREVLENSLDASYKRNLQTNEYDYLSPVIFQISGYTSLEMKTLPIDTVKNLIHTEDLTDIERVIAEAMAGAAGAAYFIEYRFKHKNGQYRWFRDKFIVMRDEHEQPLALIGSVSDITEQQRNERLLSASYERKRKNELLNELLQVNLPSTQALEACVRMMGMRIMKPFSCYLLVINSCQGHPREHWTEFGEVSQPLVDSLVDELSDDSCVSWESDDGIGVLWFGERSMNEGKAQQIRQADIFLQAISHKMLNIDVSIGIAEVAENLSEIGVHYRQSAVAVHTGRKIWPQRKIHHYLDLGVFQVLPYVSDQVQIAAYIERTLGKLLKYDKKVRTEFMETLDIVLQSDNLKEAAETLSIHYKTLLYRKQRLEAILGVALDNFDSRMAVATAVHLMKMGAQKYK